VSLLEQIGRDVDSGVLAGRVALLPMGSVEYHGPHGPLGTDTFIARELAERVRARRPALVVLPELAYTSCPIDTRRHPGTLGIPPGVTAALLEQLLRGLFTTGFAGVVVINAHIGNVGPLTFAADAVGEDFPEAFVTLLSWWETLPADETQALAGFSENGGHGHGGPLELSVTQAIVPDLVRPELAGEGTAREIDREHGRVLLDLATDRIVASIDGLLGRRGP
jgi:creatinine amidohydrolase